MQENMFESKSMSLRCRATEPETGLFFEIEVSGALTRGSDIILDKICPKKIPDFKAEEMPRLIDLCPRSRHHQLQSEGSMVSKLANSC